MKRILVAIFAVASMLPVVAQRPALVPPVVRFSDQNGKPLAGGKLYSYSAGTTTPLATYVDSTTGALNTNPVILDSTGSATVFLGANVYKLVLQNSAGVQQWSADNIAQGMFQSSTVTSVFGRSGVVTAQTGDYTCSQVTGAICTAPTQYYQTVKANGTAATQEAALNFLAGVYGSVTSPTVTAGGSGYTGAPTVTFSGGGCSTFPTGSANVTSGAVSSLVVNTAGAGCTTAPTVSFTGGGGTGATATVSLLPTGISCVDNAGAGSTDCTFNFGGGSGGGSIAPYTLTDVTSLRSAGVTYQNTTNTLMYISGGLSTSGSGTGTAHVYEGPSTANMQVLPNTATATVSGGTAAFTGTILPGYYYKVYGDGAVGGVALWTEITGGGGGAVNSLTTTGSSGAATLVGGVLNVPVYSGGGGGGTVTSVGLAMPGVLFNSTVSGSPVTTSGTFAPALITQAANTFFGNCTGSSATPSFCSASAALASLGAAPATGSGNYLNLNPTGNQAVGITGSQIVCFGVIASGVCDGTYIEKGFGGGSYIFQANLGTNQMAGSVFYGNSGEVTLAPATSSNNYAAGSFGWLSNVWNGSSSTSDTWGFIPVIGTGANPTSTFTLYHSGAGGLAAVSIPFPTTISNLTITGTCTGCGSGGSGTVNSGTAYSPAYYAATGTAVSGTTPFTGLEYWSGSAAPAAATSAQLIAAFGSQSAYTFFGNGTGSSAAPTFMSASTALTALGSGTAPTGTGVVVLATSPTLVTPALGAATATSINKVSITAPATTATLTLANNSTFTTSGAYAWQFTVPGAYTYTLPSATSTLLATNGSGSALTFGIGTLALAGNLTTTGAFNPTLAFPASNTYTFPNTASSVLVDTTATQTLSGKSIAGSEINSGTVALTNGGTGSSTAATARTALGAGMLSCQPGLGDGLNAIPAGTYLTTTCRNETGATWTLTAIRCVTDSGSSTCNVTNGTGTALLTGAITGSSTYANGTQSGTTTIASGDYLKITFITDGVTTQIGIDVAGSY